MDTPDVWKDEHFERWVYVEVPASARWVACVVPPRQGDEPHVVEGRP